MQHTELCPGRRTPSASSLPKDEAKESTAPAAMATATNGSANGSTKGTVNGAVNGHAQTAYYHGDAASEQSVEINGGSLTRQTTQFSSVRETTRCIRENVTYELPDVKHTLFSRMNIESFLEYITHERLTNMPHRGSKWDKVLKSAEYFALQISAYGEMVEKFVIESKEAVDLALGNCYLLLEVGYAPQTTAASI